MQLVGDAVGNLGWFPAAGSARWRTAGRLTGAAAWAGWRAQGSRLRDGALFRHMSMRLRRLRDSERLAEERSARCVKLLGAL